MTTASTIVGDDAQTYDWPTRTYTRTVAGTLLETRSLTPEEEAWVGPLAASTAAATAADTLRRQLVDGLANIAAAQALATADIPAAAAAVAAATTDRAAALALKAQADILAVKPSPVLADIRTLAQGLSLLCQYRADADTAFATLNGWRGKVDENAVLTDQALTFLGHLAQHDLPS